MVQLLLFYFCLSLYLTKPQLVQYQSIFDDSCIPNDEIAFFCSALKRLEQLRDSTGVIQAYIGINHTYNNIYNFDYIYHHIESRQNNQNSDINNQLTCFVYSIKDQSAIEYIFYDNSYNITESFASIKLNNIGSIMNINDDSETIYSTFTNNIASIDYTNTPIAEISTYISNDQCFEIHSFIPTAATKDHWFYIEGSFWRTPNNITQSFSTQETDTGIFNSIYCFEGEAIESSQLIFDLSVRDYTNNDQRYSNGNQLIINNWYNLSGVVNYTIPFTISGDTAYLTISLWQSCNIINADPDNPTTTTQIIMTTEDASLIAMRSKNTQISNFTALFLITICFIGFVVILYVAYLSKSRYKSSDPINYFAIIWMVLELWDFFSDIAYVIYIYYFTVYYPDSHSFFIMFGIGSLFLIAPYTLNLFYYRFLNQLWQQANAPASSRIWLKSYSWIFLLICLFTGGVHPALELTNSLLWPRALFAMHLPYSELIRVRSERFITNVLFENFPFLLLQISFYFVVSSEVSSLNGGINIVFWGTVISSILSVLFSGTYYFSYKYQNQSTIAIYSFSFGFRSDEFQHYWIHSHWRLQTAISKSLQIGTPSLIIIDAVSDIEKHYKLKFDNTVDMFVEGRVVYDTSTVKSKLQIMQDKSRKEQRIQAMAEIGSDLLSLLRKEFDLNRTTDEVTVTNLRIVNINRGKGEDIFIGYDDTMKNICCTCCCCSNDELTLRRDVSLNKNHHHHMEQVNSIEMSDYQYKSDPSIASDIDIDAINGIYVAKRISTHNKYANNKQNEPKYLRNPTLPMVSISGRDVTATATANIDNKKKKKHKNKLKKPHHHNQQHSIVSVVNVSDNHGDDSLQQDFGYKD